MLQISPVSSNSDVPNVFTREFGIDPLDNELKPDEGRKTLISLTPSIFTFMNCGELKIFLVIGNFKKLD